ncbi:DUF6114 domain-containing protein [Planosporangium sp. 12N6]|uniref:DUF6114 domain-containing protein n=1 Tax=Planosporangium spinosum TaxID=3402278 RepID=UPI003CE6F70B
MTRARLAWRGWRRSRPFWGGLLLVLSGAEILASIWAPLPVVLHVGPQGLAGYLVPTIMVVCGLLLWFNPRQRLFYAIVAILMALGSWLTSNLGGFFVGMLVGLIGGSLAFAWAPMGRPATQPRRSRRSTPEALTGTTATRETAAYDETTAHPQTTEYDETTATGEDTETTAHGESRTSGEAPR